VDAESAGSGTVRVGWSVIVDYPTKGVPHGKYPLAEHDDVHVQRLEMCWAVRILVEAPETDEVVRSEKLDLLTRFLHLNILCSKWMDSKNLSAPHLVRRPPPSKSKSDVPWKASSSLRRLVKGCRATMYVPQSLLKGVYVALRRFRLGVTSHPHEWDV
jgi:hypothetical protein